MIGAGQSGGVVMHLADQATPQELRLKGSPGGKNYIGPAGPAGGEQDREIVSFDGRVLITRFIDKDAGVRYGNWSTSAARRGLEVGDTHPSLRGASATKQSMPPQVARWIASLPRIDEIKTPASSRRFYLVRVNRPDQSNSASMSSCEAWPASPSSFGPLSSLASPSRVSTIGVA